MQPKEIKEIDEYSFDIPISNIAYYPWQNRLAEQGEDTRKGARMLIVDRLSKTITDGNVSDIAHILGEDDAVVYNNSRTSFNAFNGYRYSTNNKEEIKAQMVVVRELGKLDNVNAHFEVLVFPSRKVRNENILVMADGKLRFELIDNTTNKGRIAVVKGKSVQEVKDLMDEYGLPNLPAYIKRNPEAKDKESYNSYLATVEGSIVPPASTLFLDKRLMLTLDLNNVKAYQITNHINMGCFADFLNKKIEANNPDSQYAYIDKKTTKGLNQTKGKKLAVGINTLRTLENSVNYQKQYQPKEGYINPLFTNGYVFKGADMLLTGLHMPKSQYLIAATTFAGYELMMRAYIHAIENNYQFGIYGDAMLII